MFPDTRSSVGEGADNARRANDVITPGAVTENTAEPATSSGRRLRHVSCLLLGVIALLAVLLIAFSSARPFPEIRARLLGDDLVVEPQSVFLGDVAAGGRASGPFTFKNLSGAPILLLGASVGCRCTVVEDLPCHIPAGESRTISVSLKTTETDAGKSLEQSAWVYFNGSRTGQKTKLTVRANVLAEGSTARAL